MTIAALAEALGGTRIPEEAIQLDLLKSGEGAVLVEQILIRIDHGIYT